MYNLKIAESKNDDVEIRGEKKENNKKRTVKKKQQQQKYNEVKNTKRTRSLHADPKRDRDRKRTNDCREKKEQDNIKNMHLFFRM